MKIALDTIKKHLNIDTEFTDDDTYITMLYNVAEKAVEKELHTTLDEIEEENGNALPDPILHAMLLYIGNLYANRESVAYNAVHEVPYTFKYLIYLYRDYSNSNN